MSHTKKKILIVDDDKLLSQSVEQLFSGAGCETKVLFDGDGVEDTVASWYPDIIILDIMLPGKNGIDIIKDLCGKSKATCDKILVMTTLNDSTYLAKALELGVTNYVQKNTATPQYVFDVAMRMANK